MTAQHLELDDHLRFTLTGEKCKVVEAGTGAVTLRWPSGDRIAYSTSDGIWQHFEVHEDVYYQLAEARAQRGELLAALKHLLAISRNANAQQYKAAEAAIARAEHSEGAK